MGEVRVETASACIKIEPQHSVMTAKVTPLAAPLIRSISHDALVTWKREREQYEAQIRARCVSNGEKPSQLMVPVRQTMNYALLQSCCKFMWHASAQSISDEELVRKLNETIDCGMNTPRLDLEALLQQKLRMNLSERDLHARTIQYFMEFEAIVKQAGLRCEGTEGMKSKCDLLVKYITPDRLRDRVVVHQRFVDSSSRTCDVKLFKLVLERALELENQNEQKQQVIKPKRDAQAASLGTEATNQEPPRPLKRRLGEVSQTKAIKVRAAIQSDHMKSTDQLLVLPRVSKSCLHCGKPHLVRACPDIGADEKARLRAEYNRKQRERVVRSSA